MNVDVTPELGRAVLREVVLPGAVGVGLIAGIGRLIMGPLDGFPAEDAVNRELERRRTPAANAVTWAVSTYADTVPTIAAALGYGALARRAYGRWDLAVAPLAAITVETTVFVVGSHLVGRPRPDVTWLDKPAPTSSFPSGHTAATTALHLTFADLLSRSTSPRVRAVAPVLRWGFPPVVAYSRLYRGMHHPSDVVVGVALGVWAAGAVRRVIATRPGARV
ncbi:phosphatase PAP2 family protein [Arsenicicoccus piscis]|uniref:Phosphatidic acid phosphatase type 2/haloperoxidase domain-containing protein n=1 Tax=Arsenicicoccus piscis TaxID=673954 RepID=A0ABQ6HR71_9MICO|nr:phosphatase PAP2 family protein [Arsenicicoccus piscis]MCH8628406.1 phosphatase PAP2 family protein [Arsenicicoccus piscis]GMA20040.1 hypothetical protein GCM10025862_20610 [Arsenicicoccus piscis]